MRRLFLRALIALTLVTGLGAATTGVAVADPVQTGATSSSTQRVAGPTGSGATHRAQDWWM